MKILILCFSLLFCWTGFAKAPELKPAVSSNVVKDLAGFRLLKVEKGSLYDKFGFVKNDVITAIDGKQIDTLEDLESRLGSDKKEIAVEVIRNGKPEIFNFTLR